MENPFSTLEERLIRIENLLLEMKNVSPKGITRTPQPHIKGIHALGLFLGVSAARAQKLKNEGVFPYFQDNRLVLFDPDKVREAMANYNTSKERRK